MADPDLPFVAQLFASTRREEVAQTGWPPDVQEAFLLQQHDAQHRHYSTQFGGAEWLIITRGGEDIGRLYLHQETAEVHVLDISLLPESRGHGLGEAILRDVLAMARGLGKGVMIYVEQTNRARHLYDRLGFEAVERQGIYDLMRARS